MTTSPDAAGSAGVIRSMLTLGPTGVDHAHGQSRASGAALDNPTATVTLAACRPAALTLVGSTASDETTTPSICVSAAETGGHNISAPSVAIAIFRK